MLCITQQVGECVLVKYYNATLLNTGHVPKCADLPTTIGTSSQTGDNDSLNLLGNPGNATTQVCGYVEERVCEGCSNSVKMCVLPRALVDCDGVSQCLTDECGCKGVFLCRDRVGCIAFGSVCDGVSDCRDGSDEWLCDGDNEEDYNKRFLCSERNATNPGDGKQREVNAKAWCKSKSKDRCTPRVDHVDCSKASEVSGNSLAIDLQKCQDTVISFLQLNSRARSNSWQSPNILQSIRLACKRVCTYIQEKLCDRLFHDASTMTLIISCKSTAHLTPFDIPNETVSLIQMCDGTIDCTTSYDEKACPGRTYCTDGATNKPPEWVSDKLRCNGYKNCKNGNDECHECPELQNKIMLKVIELRVVAIFFSTLIIYFNLRLFLAKYSRGCFQFRTSDDNKMLSNFLFMQLAVYNLLMAAFLGTVGIKNMEYCVNPQMDWRFTKQCKVIGVLFSVSYHGSLVSVLIIAMAHYLKFYKHDLPAINFVTISTLMGIANLIHAIIPIIPLQFVQEIFRNDLIFTGNSPFILHKDSTKNLNHLYRIYETYFGMEVLPNTYKMIDAIRTITNEPEVFDFVEVPYYSFIPICIHDMYGFNKARVHFKVGYMIVIAVLLLMLTGLLFVMGFTNIMPEKQNNIKPEINSRNDESTVGDLSSKNPTLTNATLPQIDQLATIESNEASLWHDNDFNKTMRDNGDIGEPEMTNYEKSVSYSMKVSIIMILIFQLLIWLPYLSLNIFFFVTKNPVPHNLYEFTAVILLPINAILNPICILLKISNIKRSLRKRSEMKIFAKEQIRMRHLLTDVEQSDQTIVSVRAEMELEPRNNQEDRNIPVATVADLTLCEILNIKQKKLDTVFENPSNC